LLDFIYYHNTFGSKLSIVVKAQEASQGYGNIKLEWNNVVKFVEKPRVKEDITYIINAWIYIIDVNVVPDTGRNLKLETDFLPDYVSSLNKVKAYFHNGNWFHLQDSETLELFR
jgi:NDP-sugar pyrophosphorylase family protein